MHIDYCNNICGGTNHRNRDKILKLQKRAARVIFDDYGTPSKKLFSKLKWLPVDNRIAHSKAVLVCKSLALYNLVLIYMTDLFTSQSNSLYSLRSETQGNLVVPKPITQLYKQSLSYSGAKSWNSLPVSIRQCSSLGQFKKLSVHFQASGD